jgi:hypothetical protein
MYLLRWSFRWPCGSGDTMPSSSPSMAGLDHMPPLVEYSPRIAPADAMVIDFGSKNRVVAL